MEQQIKDLLDTFSLEEIFEMCDIDQHRVIEILIEGGHIEIPEFLLRTEEEETDY